MPEPDTTDDSRSSKPPGDAPPPGCVQDRPYTVFCAPGKYAYCQCKRSARFPLCDGTHRGSEFRPLKLILDTERTVQWCACGRSKTIPFCDGSHADRGAR